MKTQFEYDKRIVIHFAPPVLKLFVARFTRHVFLSTSNIDLKNPVCKLFYKNFVWKITKNPFIVTNLELKLNLWMKT